MLGTYFAPAEYALARWLRRLKLTGYVPSAEAADLLRDRLVARRRALVCSVPGFAVSAALMIYGVTRPAAIERSHSPSSEWPWLVGWLTFTVSIIGWHELSRRFDKRTGARLPRRAARPTPATTRVVLGRGVVAGIALAVILQIVMGSVLFAQRVDLVSWAFVASCAVAWAFAIVGVARAVTRPMIAVDELTTAIDDRLRSGEAARACEPLTFATFAFGLAEGVSANEGIFFLGLYGPLIVSLFIASGLYADRWVPRLAPNAPMITRTGGRLR